MPEFRETPHQIEVEMKISAYEGIGKHKADISIGDILSHLRFKPGGHASDSGWLLTEFHSRLAAPWTCLVVVLIAIPFGADPAGEVCSREWRAAFSSASPIF